jgi:hypothetical protein
VELPAHLRTIAQVRGELKLEIESPVTLRAVLDAIEAKYPALGGTIRDHVTKQRRAFVRFFACEQDLSHDSVDAPLPEAVVNGKEPLLVVGAIAGGRGTGIDTSVDAARTSARATNSQKERRSGDYHASFVYGTVQGRLAFL